MTIGEATQRIYDSRKERAKGQLIRKSDVIEFYNTRFPSLDNGVHWSRNDIINNLDCIQPVNIWHDPEDPPNTDRVILISLLNHPAVITGRYIQNEDGSGTYHSIEDDDRSLIGYGLIVDGWMELPKRRSESGTEADHRSDI